MALKTLIPFPITTTTPTTTPTTTTTTTEIRFSRWHNPNFEKLQQTRRTQHQIEQDLRRLRRFESAVNISTTPQTPPPPPPPFKSTGTPSSPSHPSIPAKKSKYSKNTHSQRQSQRSSHPAFRPVSCPTRVPSGETDIRVGENGLTYVVPGAPFEFMYSYTETPKNVRPVGLREPAVTPFGPGTMPRPWTGKKPLPGSKKKLPEFDSFKVPESGKKGVKTVQKPGPFLPGTGPRYVKSREEVLGEPLTVEEVKDLVQGCRKTKRQLNMGRDGLTHNMLDNIHAHWKRRRVCKIKCKGVCTVDMDNVCQQLEEKTGGKIIYHRGGIIYLFRGRNYNYKTRPRYPLMLWKPVTPVYPRLISRVPEGLTLEEATDMRRRGRELIPICKLGKNGVYAKLAKNVREAFEECELVRINCQGLNPSDYRKIGAKLKDLVPCVLISFENEHILMWRGRDWKPSILSLEDDTKGDKSFEIDGPSSHGSTLDNFLDSKDEDDDDEDDDDDGVEDDDDDGVEDDDGPLHSSNISNEGLSDELSSVRPNQSDDIEVKIVTKAEVRSFVKDGSELDVNVSNNVESSLANSPIDSTSENESETSSQCTKGVVDLLRQAVESGRAMILDDGSSLDADVVYERSVDFSKGAPPGPVYRHSTQKVAVKKPENRKTSDVGAGEAEAEVEVGAAVMSVVGPVKKSNEMNTKEQKRSKIDKGKDLNHELVDVVPQGSLKIDELAKLLTS